MDYLERMMDEAVAKDAVYCGTCRYFVGYKDCLHPNALIPTTTFIESEKPWKYPSRTVAQVKYVAAEERNAHNDCPDYAPRSLWDKCKDFLVDCLCDREPIHDVSLIMLVMALLMGFLSLIPSHPAGTGVP